MNNQQINYFLTSAISFTLLLLLVLLYHIIQFKKKQSTFCRLTDDIQKGFRLQLLHTEAIAQETAFRAIAREIHDNIGLSLTTLKLYLNRLLSGTETETNHGLIRSVGMVSRVIDQLRNISRSMNGDVLEDLGLVNVLREEVERTNQLNQVKLELKVEGEQVNFAQVREVAILRIIQELINNLLKHSQASQATIELRYTAEQLFLQISDNGIGMVSAEERKIKGTGLINIHKRIEMLEGNCTLSEHYPQGTSIHISIPIIQ